MQQVLVAAPSKVSHVGWIDRCPRPRYRYFHQSDDCHAARCFCPEFVCRHMGIMLQIVSNSNVAIYHQLWQYELQPEKVSNLASSEAFSQGTHLACLHEEMRYTFFACCKANFRLKLGGPLWGTRSLIGRSSSCDLSGEISGHDAMRHLSLCPSP